MAPLRVWLASLLIALRLVCDVPVAQAFAPSPARAAPESCEAAFQREVIVQPPAHFFSSHPNPSKKTILQIESSALDRSLWEDSVASPVREVFALPGLAMVLDGILSPSLPAVQVLTQAVVCAAVGAAFAYRHGPQTTKQFLVRTVAATSINLLALLTQGGDSLRAPSAMTIAMAAHGLYNAWVGPDYQLVFRRSPVHSPAKSKVLRELARMTSSQEGLIDAAISSLSQWPWEEESFYAELEQAMGPKWTRSKLAAYLGSTTKPSSMHEYLRKGLAMTPRSMRVRSAPLISSASSKRTNAEASPSPQDPLITSALKQLESAQRQMDAGDFASAKAIVRRVILNRAVREEGGAVFQQALEMSSYLDGFLEDQKGNVLDQLETALSDYDRKPMPSKRKLSSDGAAESPLVAHLERLLGYPASRRHSILEKYRAYIRSHREALEDVLGPAPIEAWDRFSSPWTPRTGAHERSLLAVHYLANFRVSTLFEALSRLESEQLSPFALRPEHPALAREALHLIEDLPVRQEEKEAVLHELQTALASQLAIRQETKANREAIYAEARKRLQALEDEGFLKRTSVTLSDLLNDIKLVVFDWDQTAWNMGLFDREVDLEAAMRIVKHMAREAKSAPLTLEQLREYWPAFDLTKIAHAMKYALTNDAKIVGLRNRFARIKKEIEATKEPILVTGWSEYVRFLKNRVATSIITTNMEVPTLLARADAAGIVDKVYRDPSRDKTEILKQEMVRAGIRRSKSTGFLMWTDGEEDVANTRKLGGVAGAILGPLLCFYEATAQDRLLLLLRKASVAILNFENPVVYEINRPLVTHRLRKTHA